MAWRAGHTFDHDEKGHAARDSWWTQIMRIPPEAHQDRHWYAAAMAQSSRAAARAEGDTDLEA